MGRNEVHGNEPLLQGEVGILEDGTDEAGEVMLALIATETVISALYTMMFAAFRADHIITPTSLGKGLLTDFLVVEVLNDCDDGVELIEINHIFACINHTDFLLAKI